MPKSPRKIFHRAKNCRCPACRDQRRAERERKAALCKNGLHPISFSVRKSRYRRCSLCKAEERAALELSELRWLNGPCAEASSIPAWGAGDKISAWQPHEKRLHGTRNRKIHNPWNSAFESPWQEPECWQEILQQSRPTPAEERWLRARACINERARRWRKRVGRETLNARDRERYRKAKQAA